MKKKKSVRHNHERKYKRVKERDRRRNRKQKIDKESQMKKTKKKKERERKSRRQKRIAYKKTKIKKINVSFREQITTKKERKKMTELRFARYIPAGKLSSRNPSEESHRLQKQSHIYSVV